MSSPRGFFHAYLLLPMEEMGTVRRPRPPLRGSPFRWAGWPLDVQSAGQDSRSASHELTLWPLMGHLAPPDFRVTHHAYLIARVTQTRNAPEKSKDSTKGRSHIFVCSLEQKMGETCPLESESALIYLYSLASTSVFFMWSGGFFLNLRLEMWLSYLESKMSVSSRL